MGRNIRKQRGFTLIELIVVIIILGILAAAALPRFPALQSSARASALSGLQGSMNSAMALVHSQAIVSNRSLSGADTVTLEQGQQVSIVNGYPDATANGIMAAINVATTNNGYVMAYGTGSMTVTMSGATTPANCTLTYTEATGTAVATALLPTTSGC